MDETAALVAQLKDPSKEQRLAAAVALSDFERISTRSIAPLIEATRDDEREVRLAAVKTLVRIWRTITGPAEECWISEDEFDPLFERVNHALKQSLRDDDKHIRLEAAEGLRDLYCSDQEVFDVFIAAAKDEDESLRHRSALAFSLGVSDRRAPLWQVKTDLGLAVLVGLLKDDSERVRRQALNAVKSIGLTDEVDAPGLSEALQNLLQDPDEQVRFNAACVLSSSARESESALPILIEWLSDDDVLKRKAAAFALRKFGPGAAPAIPALLRALQDSEVKVRARAAEALGQFGTEVDDSVINALLEAELEAERKSDREMTAAVKRALTAIGKVQIDAAQTRTAAYKSRDFFPLSGFKPQETPFWLLMLWDADANHRARAVTALGHLGATEAIPELRRLLNDEDEDVRRRVLDVLKRFGNAGEAREANE